MESSTVFRLIYASLGIFGTFLMAVRLADGAWLAALWPLAIVGFCAYRLYVMTSTSTEAP